MDQLIILPISANRHMPRPFFEVRDQQRVLISLDGLFKPQESVVILDALQEELQTLLAFIGQFEHFFVNLAELLWKPAINNWDLDAFVAVVVFMHVETELKRDEFFVDSLVVLEQHVC